MFPSLPVVIFQKKKKEAKPGELTSSASFFVRVPKETRASLLLIANDP